VKVQRLTRLAEIDVRDSAKEILTLKNENASANLKHLAMRNWRHLLDQNSADSKTCSVKLMN
jgi:hypothetical protein